MEWVRGGAVGRGSFGTVNLAIPRTNSTQFPPPPLMVVKSSPLSDSNSNSLHNEREILSQFIDCPQVVQCYGNDTTVEGGVKYYNLFLEYATRGSLADQLKKIINKFADSDIRRYTRSILKGLSEIHNKGFVHCDIKLQNVLLFENGVAKIADFGLAKKRVADEIGTEKKNKNKKPAVVLKGTPLNMSPEVLNGGEIESPADIWALGCSVIEMITGKSGYNCSPECDVTALFYRIVVGGEVPEIPGSLCEDGQDFLKRCFIKDPNQRWTADMLLDHPFVSRFEFDQLLSADIESESCSFDYKDEQQPSSVSPRGPFDFPDWVSMVSPDSNQSSIPSSGFSNDLQSELDMWEREEEAMQMQMQCQPSSSRIRELVTECIPDWSDSDGWIAVR